MAGARRASTPLLAAAVCAVLAGCGQKGPLIQPDARDARAAPAAGTTEETTSDEGEEEDNDG